MRKPAARTKPRIAKPHIFPAPSRGWIANENLADPTPGGAAMLENWAPTATGARVRAGSETYVTLGDGSQRTEAMFTYLNGLTEKLFGSTDGATYDISTSSPALVRTHTNGEWVVIQFATTGGVYLFGVNGVDQAFLYDGTSFFPISGVPVYRLNYDTQTVNFTVGTVVTGGISLATGTILSDSDSGTSGFLTLTGVSGTFQDNETLTGTPGAALVNGAATTLAPAITGLATTSLSYVWSYKNRAFFIQKDSLDAWYLPVDSVGGALTKLPLGAVFSRGGSLLFGATWSLDSGASGGLSEQCIFVSTEGEVAVFQGTDPNGGLATWSKVGVYRIGRPLGKKAFTRPGGDVLIATDIGYIPLSQAIQKDVAALSPNSVSYPIETAWNDRVDRRGSEPWHCEIWPTKQIAVIALPTVADERAEMLIANVRTGAWSVYTGWEGTCLALFKDRLFFGSEDGLVIEAEVTGADNGLPYVATCVPLFSDLRSPAAVKTSGMARAVLLSPYPLNERLSIQADFSIRLPVPPDAASIGDLGVWGLGVWGTSTWGSANAKKPYQQWRSVAGYGYALAPAIQITSGSVPPPNIELVRLEILVQSGDVGS